MMSFAEAARAGFMDKSFTFSGRASRAEFWWIFLQVGILSFLIELVWPEEAGGNPILLWVLVALYALVSVVCWTAWARRMHDRGWSAIWIAPLNIIGIAAAVPGFDALLDAQIDMIDAAAEDMIADNLAPLLALAGAGIFLMLAVLVGLVFLVLMAWPGTAGPNRYGPDPLHPETDAEVFA